jgi:hypothetical protein
MSLVALKRKTNAKYGNHSNKNGFSINGNTRYPGYIGKNSYLHRSGVNQGNICCAYETNSPEGFKTVKNYNAINKHGNLTRWYKRDYTQAEWNAKLNEAGLSINDYPYPRPGTLQVIKNNWVQTDLHSKNSAHIYTHNKKQTSLQNEYECNKNNEINNFIQEKTQCANNSIQTENGVIKNKCIDISKDIGIGKSSDTSIERAKHRRALLNPRGYEKPFPYDSAKPSYRACHTQEKQVFDAIKGGYYTGAIVNKCVAP